MEGVVEVDDDLSGSDGDLQAAAVGVLDRVDQVAAAAVGLLPGGGVQEGHEEAAAVADHGQHRQRAGPAQEAEAERADAAVADDAVLTARVDLDRRPVGRLHPGGDPVGGVGREPGQPAE
jgi:hypothetical protein